jgi:hypothetical protein
MHSASSTYKTTFGFVQLLYRPFPLKLTFRTYFFPKIGIFL